MILPHLGSMLNLEDSTAIRALTHEPGHHFFGYYDKSPWDASGRWILGLRVPFMERPPGPDDEAEVGLIDTLQGDEWAPLATTRAWNWQQGCMLQWLGGGPEILFNDRREGRFIARILHPQTGVERRIPRPIYAADPEGGLGLSINFSRLHHQRPGYGYAGVPDPWEATPEPEEDGIFACDLATGESRLLLSIAEAARHERDASFDGKIHRFNHLQFSRQGDRFAFLHRYRADGPHTTRLLTMGMDGGDLQTLSDHGMVSHYDWHPDGSLIAWASRRGAPDGYWLFPPGGGEPRPLRHPAFGGDGHCSFSPCGRYLLTDSYPDAAGEQTLMVFHLKRRELVYSRQIRALPLADEIRCDLHPRWSRAGGQICIDSAFGGSRQMYLLSPHLPQ